MQCFCRSDSALLWPIDPMTHTPDASRKTVQPRVPNLVLEFVQKMVL